MHKQTLFTRGWKLVSIVLLASILISLLGTALAEPNETSDTSSAPWTESESLDPSAPDISEGGGQPEEPEVFTEGDFRYTVDQGNATVYEYVGNGGDVVVPGTLGGYPVTKIGAYAFEGRRSVTSVELPDSVVTIEESAFWDCISMTSIKLSSNLTTIADEAFASCVKLLELELPDSLTSIGFGFLFMSGVQSIFIPKGVTSIQGLAFVGFDPNDLTDDVLEDLAPYIPETQLTDIYFEVESPLDTWSPYWNEDCTAALHWGATRPDPSHERQDGDYKYTVKNDEATITAYTGEGGDVVVPGTLGGYTVTVIGKEAFQSCSGLTIVELPDGLKTIGAYAFSDCFYLDSIGFPDGLVTIGAYAFEGCAMLSSIDLPASVTSIGEYAFIDCMNLNSITVQTGNPNYESVSNCLIEKASGRLLRGCSGVAIPDGVKAIEAYAFNECFYLTHVIIPDSVTKIGSCAFEECYNLHSVFIPDSVTEIGADAFASCSNSTIYCEAPSKPEGWDPYWNPESADVHWGASRNDVPIEGFEDDCVYSVEDGQATITEFLGSGEDVTVPETVNGYPVTEIGDNAFYGCEDLESVELPSSVTKIGENAFFNCGSLESVNLPSGCAAIGAYAFHGCDSLENIAIPASVTSIGEAAFGSCGSLTSITVQAGNPNYESVGNCLIEKKTGRLLRGCADSVIPNSVKVIGEEAFSFSGLTSVVIPEGVTTIEHDAFWFCGALTNVVIPGSVTSIGSHAFTRCTALKSIVIPKSVVSIGEYAFGSDNGLTVYCEASSKPNGWNANWVDASDGITVKWNYGSPDEPAKPVMVGDLSGDGKVNSTDYMLLKRHVLGTYKLSDAYLAFADFSGDGRVNSTDYMLLKRAVLGTYKLAAK